MTSASVPGERLTDEDRADLTYMEHALPADLAERILARIEKAEAEVAEYADHTARLGDILTRTANALKGEPEPLHLHGWADLPDRAAYAVRCGADAIARGVELEAEVKELRAERDKAVEEYRRAFGESPLVGALCFARVPVGFYGRAKAAEAEVSRLTADKRRCHALLQQAFAVISPEDPFDSLSLEISRELDGDRCEPGKCTDACEANDDRLRGAIVERDETIGRLTAELEEERAKLRDPRHLFGVDEPCPKCGGRGRRGYACTSTWRGGAGGSTITDDVCDACWGSGERDRVGADLRKIMAQIEGARADERRKIEREIVAPLLHWLQVGIEYMRLAAQAKGRGDPVNPAAFEKLEEIKRWSRENRAEVKP